MRKIHINLPKIRIKRNFAKWEKTLLDYDGPQVGLIKLRNGNSAISVAYDSNDDEVKFIAAEVSDRQINNFSQQLFDLRYLFEKPHFKRWFIFALQQYSDIEDFIVSRVEYDKITKEDMFPSHGMFAANLSDSISATNFNNFEEIKIDGAWTMKDFSILSRRIEQIYSMYMALNKVKNNPSAVQSDRRFESLFSTIAGDWIGGGKYVSFYDSLKSIAVKDGLTVKQIQYASPGKIEVYADESAFKEVEGIVKNFLENRSNIYIQYKNLDDFITKARLRACSPDRYNEIKFSDNTDSELYGYTRKLSEALMLNDFHIIEKIASNNLILSKISLSFYRRIRDLSEFFIEGRASF